MVFDVFGIRAHLLGARVLVIGKLSVLHGITRLNRSELSLFGRELFFVISIYGEDLHLDIFVFDAHRFITFLGNEKLVKAVRVLVFTTARRIGNVLPTRVDGLLARDNVFFGITVRLTVADIQLGNTTRSLACYFHSLDAYTFLANDDFLTIAVVDTRDVDHTQAIIVTIKAFNRTPFFGVEKDHFVDGGFLFKGKVKNASGPAVWKQQKTVFELDTRISTNDYGWLSC